MTDEWRALSNLQQFKFMTRLLYKLNSIGKSRKTRVLIYLLPVIIQARLRREVTGIMNVLQFPEDINAG